MNNKRVMSNLLLAVNKLVNKLTDEEMKKIEEGKFELSFNFSKEKSSKAEKTIFVIEEKSFKTITDQLDLAKSREEGLEIIESTLKNKNELELFAKHIDVAVMRSDKVEAIKSNIVDATVGARLRSNAIQGKKI